MDPQASPFAVSGLLRPAAIARSLTTSSALNIDAILLKPSAKSSLPCWMVACMFKGRHDGVP